VNWLRTIIAVLGIQFVWVVIGLTAVLAFAATDCATPQCQAQKSATMQLILWVCFVGFMASIAVYFYRRNRNSGRS